MEELRMSLKEAERLSIMKQIDKNSLTLKKASEEIGLSLRQLKRIRKRYRKEGEQGLISRKRGVPSNRKFSKKLKDKVIRRMKEKYVNFGPTLAREKLEEMDHIKISAETLRLWLIKEGLWKAKKKRAIKVHQRRERRSCFGELLQGDGSFHDWFEGRGEKCVLLQFVDDATGKTTAARFVERETTDEYLEILKEHLEKYGRPQALYVDKHSIFRVNREECKKGFEVTRFGQVMKELGIELICAHSAPAKGRVERKHGLYQDRLVKEFRLREIDNIERANEFLPRYLAEMNLRFGKEPARPEDGHRPMRVQDNLDRIFAKKERRKLSKNLTFQYEGVLYLIQSKTPNRMRHAYVEVIDRKGEEIAVEYQGKRLDYKKWSETMYEQPKVLNSKEMVTSWRSSPPKPKRNHPWR